MHDLCQNSDIVLYCENIEQIIEIILNSVATTEMTSHRVDSDRSLRNSISSYLYINYPFLCVNIKIIINNDMSINKELIIQKLLLS